MSAVADTGTSAVRQVWSRIGLDRERAVFALQISMAASVALFFAFLIDLPNTYWALLTIPLVVRQQSGMTVWRSAARVGGTLIGAFVALFFVGFFAQSAPAMLACLALWIFGCGFLARFEIGADAYAYGTAGLTALVIAIDTGPNADLVFQYALSRSTETLIAVVAGFMVMLVVFPRSITQSLSSDIADARRRVFDLMRKALDVYDEQPLEERKAVLVSLNTIFTELRARRFERSHAAPGVSRVAAATNRLNHMLVAGESLSFVLARYRAREARSERIERARETFADLLSQVPDTPDDAQAALAHAADLRAFARGVERGDAMRAAASGTSSTDRLDALVLYRLHGMAVAAARFLEADAAVLDRSLPSLRHKPVNSRYRDVSAAMQKGLRPMVAFLAAATVWVVSGWQNGSVFTLITGALTLLFPTIVPRANLVPAGKRLAFGFFCGGILAAALLTTLPIMQDFAGFLFLFAPVIFVIFYLCAGGENLPVAIGSTVMLAVAMQPSNEQSYDLLRVFNIMATLMMMPAALIAAVTIVHPEDHAWLRRHLRRGTDKLLAALTARRGVGGDGFLAQMIDMVADYGGDLDPGDATDARLIERSRASTHAGLELDAVHRLAETRRLPADLAKVVPDMDGAVRRAAALHEADAGPASEPSRALDAIARNVRDHLANETERGLQRGAILRLAMACELLCAIVDDGRLALPDGT